ncbi:hypothetical protein HanIR_Chr11g0553801 [Helianthus annuus]|nr:hypothetical protein HanIR_Chr11g0553801 [Helianthus annuus]
MMMITLVIGEPSSSQALARLIAVETSSSRVSSSFEVVLEIARAESSRAQALGFTREPSSSSEK